MNEIKYSKNVEWMKPFVDAVEHLVPLKKVNNIRGYSVSLGLEERCYGGITTIDHKKYSINIKVKELVDHSTRHKDSVIATTLDTLAHELAHMKEWEHTHAHLKLQARILIKFSSVLKQLGIEDTSHRVNTLNKK